MSDLVKENTKKEGLEEIVGVHRSLKLVDKRKLNQEIADMLLVDNRGDHVCERLRSGRL